jgi:ABC-type multidrug transport system ATPase subunit
MSALLEIRGLRKRFGRSEVLKGIDLTLHAGAVYGFVGLNGAGKTTTIECSLGLLRRTGGEVSVLGRPPGEIWRTAGRVGVALDTPCLHPHLTVREELDHAAIFCGREGRTPAEVEELLGIAGHRSQKTRKLSLGNRRRTSIALALLGRPELVVLDEPFSGLDAGGVEDLLALIGKLHRDEGMAILFSSHQLDLVERAATHVGLIHEGRMVREGALEEVVGGGRERLRIRVDDPVKALFELRGRKAGLLADGSLEVDLEGPSPAEVNAQLVRAGIGVSELRLERPSLAQLFHQVVKKETVE